MKVELYRPQAIWELGQRTNQEDAIFPLLGEATDKDRLFILCDGMGGHEHGEVASQTVCKAMSKFFLTHREEPFTDSMLNDALEAAYQQLDSLDSGGVKKMGTTLCLLYFHQGGLTAAHIGDSRIYHIRPSENRIIYQSRDHSLVYDLYQAGEIGYEDMANSPQKNIITRAIQPGEDNRVNPAIVHITDIRPGDYFFICSDGMLEQMDNDTLCTLISSNLTDEDEEKRAQLIKSTYNNKDNHSAYLIHVRQIIQEEDDNQLSNDEQTSSDNAINIRPRHKCVLSSDEDVQVVSTNKHWSPTSKNGPRKSSQGMILGLFGGLLLIIVLAMFFWSGQSEREKRQTESKRVPVTSNPLSPISGKKATKVIVLSHPKTRKIVEKDTTIRTLQLIDRKPNVKHSLRENAEDHPLRDKETKRDHAENDTMPTKK